MTAVVLTRNRPDAFARALDSLDRTEAPLTILVIDNNSEPGAAKRVAATCAARDNVQLRRMDRNLGCAGGRVLGSALAQTECVLFLDDDAELMPGALELLAADLDAHPEAGAVTATVVGPDGTLYHSGGSLKVESGVATFGLVGSGVTLTPEAVPPSGLADWVPGTAVLIRRELLEAFPIDERMAAYYEDNEWCYRVSLTHPTIFRRSREAVAWHYMAGAEEHGSARSGRPTRVERLAAYARFYARHDVLLGPWVFHDVPQLTGSDGTRDLAGFRILMELVTAKGVEWTEAAWSSGELVGLINAHRWRSQLSQAHSEIESLQRTVREQEATLAWLSNRHGTLCRIEQGGWWRLRGRVLPAIRLLQWLGGWWKSVLDRVRTSHRWVFSRHALVRVGADSEPGVPAVQCWVSVSGERFRVRSLDAELDSLLLYLPLSRAVCSESAHETSVVVTVDGLPLTVEFAGPSARRARRGLLAALRSPPRAA